MFGRILLLRLALEFSRPCFGIQIETVKIFRCLWIPIQFFEIGLLDLVAILEFGFGDFADFFIRFSTDPSKVWADSSRRRFDGDDLADTIDAGPGESDHDFDYQRQRYQNEEPSFHRRILQR